MARLPVLVFVLAALAGGCGAAGDDGRDSGGGAGAGGDRDQLADADQAAREKPKPKPLLPRGRGHILARVRRAVLVHRRPGGRPVARLRRRTPFGHRRVLGVLETRGKGRWLGIHSPVLGNNRIGWIANDRRKLKLRRTRTWLDVDLSSRRVVLHRGPNRRRIPIAIGRAGTATPSGRFQVTDKMKGSRFPRAPYGCCILALSARQPNLPPGWPGGDRIALHGTPLESTIGSAASNGCLRASDRHMRVLMRRVPVGARVVIRQ
jgi:hypothetical protein